MENGATEGAEVLRPTAWVRASDTGDAPAIVATGEEPLHGLRDPLKAELPEAFGELGIVTSDELGEVISEEPLEGARASLAVGPRRGRIQREGELVGHKEIHAPEGRVASPRGSGRDPALRNAGGIDTCRRGSVGP